MPQYGAPMGHAARFRPPLPRICVNKAGVGPCTALKLQMLGHSAIAHAKQQHITRRRFCNGFRQQMPRGGRPQAYNTLRFGLIHRIGRHMLRLSPQHFSPLTTQQPQTICSRTTGLCLMHIRCPPPNHGQQQPQRFQSNSSSAAPPVCIRAFGITHHPNLSRKIGKALVIHNIGKLGLTGLKPLIAAS